jgi:RNA polymerase sigma factor (sigma-70 family)
MSNTHLDNVLQHVRQLGAADTGVPSDAELLERFVAGQDEAAFAALMRRHGPMVLAVCRRVLRHEQDAEDACQAAFLVLARQAGSIRKRESVSSFLHGVAYRIAAHLRLDTARRRAREVPAVDMPQPEGADVSWREVRAILDEELARLPLHYRTPVLLCYLEGLTRDEAAGRLGWGLGTLRGRLERGREMLRTRLTRRGLTLSSALLSTLAMQESALAALPSALVADTTRAALLAAGGQSTAGAVSTQVVALSEGAVTAMSTSRLSIVAVILLTLGLAGAGAGLLGPSRPAEQQAARQKPAPRTAEVNEKELDALIKALSSPDVKTRVQAAKKIGALGPRAKRAAPALAEVLAKRDRDPDVDHAVSIALWKVDRAAFTAILKRNKRPDRARFVLVLALTNIRAEAKELAPLVLKIANDPSDPDRYHALLALGSIGADPAKAVPVLVEALEDEAGQYRRMLAAQGLGFMGPKAKAALPALYRALDDPDSQVRVDAATAVWKIEGQTKKVLPVLTEALKEGERSAARQRAVRCLRDMGPKAKEAFAALLAHWKAMSGHAKNDAARALKAIDPKGAAREGVK